MASRWVHRQGSHRSGKSGNSGKILKTFSNQGKTGSFQPKSGKKCEVMELFFQNYFQPFKHFNPRKKTFLSGEVLPVGSVSVINWCFCKHCPNGKYRPHLKRIIMGFLAKLSCRKLRKNQGKILGNQGKSGKNQRISWDKKVGTLIENPI